MQTEPGSSASTSSRAVCAFMQPMMSTSFLRAIQPSLFARMVNQVGSPAMLDGNMFLPLTGTPIWKMERIRTLFDDCDPEPLTVATWIVQSLTVGRAVVWGSSSTAVMVASDTVCSSSIGAVILPGYDAPHAPHGLGRAGRARRDDPHRLGRDRHRADQVERARHRLAHPALGVAADQGGGNRPARRGAGARRSRATLHPDRQPPQLLRYPVRLRGHFVTADPLHGQGQPVQDSDLRLVH